MEHETGYLDRLPHLTPVDELAVPSGAGGLRRGRRTTNEVVMIVSGVGLVLACGLLLFFV
jgi:hypothetical protein